jgi:hypothetical protein
MQALKLVVVGLGVLIVVSIGLLGWGFYTKLKRSEEPQSAAPASSAAIPQIAGAPLSAGPAAAFGESRVPLPPGCTVIEMLPDGETLYVRTGPAGVCERILVLDGRTGRLIGSFVLTP